MTRRSDGPEVVRLPVEQCVEEGVEAVAAEAPEDEVEVAHHGEVQVVVVVDGITGTRPLRLLSSRLRVKIPLNLITVVTLM